MNLGKWAPIFFALCTGVSDTAYRTHVFGIIHQALTVDDLNEQNNYAFRFIRKSIRYSKLGANENIAARCFLIELYCEERGIPISRASIYRHGMKHWIDENFPGEGIEP